MYREVPGHRQAESGVEVDLNVLNVSIPYLTDKVVLCCCQQMDA